VYVAVPDPDVHFAHARDAGAQVLGDPHEVSTRRLSGILDGVEAAESAASEFAVRRAFSEDAQAIGAVFDAAVRASWTLLDDVAQRPMFSAKDWDQLVTDHAPPNALFVATDAGHGVIGYAAVHTEAGEMFLLFVHPAHTGRGVRRALLDAAHDVLRAAGHTEAFLFTEERNTRGRAVYAAAGYRPDGTVRESELHGVTLRELRLVKTL
jgi:GNAT superfamily N-acetyltransferase